MRYHITQKPNQNANGRRQKREAGEMNKTEAAYADHLELLRRAGEILWFAYECLKYRLADNTYFTPDFAVMLASGELQAHEVKGHWEDDARVKIKVAAERFPIQFIAMKPLPKKLGGGWQREEF